jgi:photosystem II stability/assembly factor-like uncharacterized protein
MKKITLIALIISLSFILSACGLSVRRSGDLGVAGGVFVSGNQGNTWKNMSFSPSTSGEPISLTHLDVKEIVVDPSDDQALYMATYGRGLFYTYNLNEGWRKVNGLPTATINSVAINPDYKCTIFASVANRLYKSVDCTRTWTQVYSDDNPEVAVTSVVIDHYNSDNIYITTSRGEVIKSINRGDFWRTIHRFNNGVIKLKISPQDSRLLFVATSRNEFFSFNSPSIKSDNLEENFTVSNMTNLSEVLENIRRTNIREINICSKEGVIILATEQKLLRSPDNGITWEDIDLIPSERDASIKAVAINPQNSQELYYATDTNFYRSQDGGVSWNTKRLPTQRAGSSLLVSPANPQIIYLGVRKEDK